MPIAAGRCSIMIKNVLAAFAVVVSVAACGGPEPDMPQAVAKKGTNFPELYDKDCEPVGGGFYAVTPSSGDLAPVCHRPE
jgi:hypothetical protein